VLSDDVSSTGGLFDVRAPWRRPACSST